jgi:hypothetical protein
MSEPPPPQGIPKSEITGNENTAAPALTPPPISLEKWWELKEIELWDKISKRVFKLLGAFLTVFLAIITIFGAFGIQYYINWQFKDITEQETKIFNKLHDSIEKDQATLYADEKIVLVIFDKYLREKQNLPMLSLKAIDEINQSDLLNAAEMAEFKKFVINGIDAMQAQAMRPGQYKNFINKIKENNQKY